MPPRCRSDLCHAAAVHKRIFSLPSPLTAYLFFAVTMLGFAIRLRFRYVPFMSLPLRLSASLCISLHLSAIALLISTQPLLRSSILFSAGAVRV